MTRIKVSGYARRIFYSDGIEYRDFSPDLVGQQYATGNSIFTSNNFIVTTNIDPKQTINYARKPFSNFFTLNSINVDPDVEELLNDKIKLNVDRSKIDSYAYFGSLKEFIRVSLEEIILTWPASLYVRPTNAVDNLTEGATVYNYVYNNITNTSTFKIDSNFIYNTYGINYLSNGTIISLFKNDDPLKILTNSFSDYIIDNEKGTFDVLELTGATSERNSFIYLKTTGNPFSGSTAFTETFHLRPNDVVVEKFYRNLDNFKSYLLNRNTVPKFKSTFKYPIRTEEGVILYINEILTWPITDGYNLDFSSDSYSDYVTALINIAESFDSTKTDLIHRFLTSESISSFDTYNEDEEGEDEQKITKLLRIYGRGYDDIKQFIDGLSYGNHISYDKKENIPDKLVKTLAKTMGWDITPSLIDNDIIEYFLKPSDSAYSGMSVGMTTAESEIEMWRRLILNSPWLFKSKGSRKAIEFLLRFIGTPNGLVEFKEYIYRADNKVDVDLIKSIYEARNEDFNFDDVWFDSEGYPKTLRNTSDMYFQKQGLWYRETGGANVTIPKLTGNNPHIGPYDSGEAYLSNFQCLIPDFEPITIIKETITSGETELYLNYNEGKINDCNVTSNPSVITSYFDVLLPDNSDGTQCYDFEVLRIDDPHPTVEETDCGCPIDDCDHSIKICITKKDEVLTSTTVCDLNGFELLPNGEVEFVLSDSTTTKSVSDDCCSSLGFTPLSYHTRVRSSSDYNSGQEEFFLINGMMYQDIIIPGSVSNVRLFISDEDGNITTVVFDSTEESWQNIILYNNNDDIEGLELELSRNDITHVVIPNLCYWTIPVIEEEITEENETTTTVVNTYMPPPLFIRSIEKIDTTCGENNGNISVFPFGGTPEYGITIIGPDGFEKIGEFKLDNLSPGIYKVTVNDSMGKTVEDTVTIGESVGIEFIGNIETTYKPIQTDFIPRVGPKFGKTGVNVTAKSSGTGEIKYELIQVYNGNEKVVKTTTGDVSNSNQTSFEYILPREESLNSSFNLRATDGNGCTITEYNI